MYDIDLENINKELEKMTPFDRLQWGRDTFKEKFCITSSFGINSAVMAHIVSEVAKETPILFLDTGYHFSETIAYKEYLSKKYGLYVIEIKPELTRMEFEEKHGYAYDFDQDLCCMHNKVIPLRHALEDYDCWATGIRRGQTTARKRIDFLVEHYDHKRDRQTFKLSPIADYNNEDVENHFKLYGLPEHPLKKEGYLSVGCGPCTDKALDHADERSGRWRGKSKSECGIHLMHGQGEGI